MNAKTSLLLLPVVLLSVAPLPAQEKPRVSPHETVSATIDGNEMKIVYGRPYTKDPKSGEKRKIWGGLVPFGKTWRMGADEATLFTTARAIDMNGTTIPAGTYSLFLLPEENGARLIINKQTGQWGTRHDEKQDLARIDLKKEPASAPVDQFTIAIDKKDGGGGVLKITWEEIQYSAPFTVQK